MKFCVVKLLGCSAFIFFFLNVSGCLTSSLSSKIGSGTETHVEYSSDNIVGFSEGVDRNKTQGWVFVGKNFDYLLTSGGDVIVNILNDGNVNKRNISAKNSGRFLIWGKGDLFNGDLSIFYTYDSNDDKNKIDEILKKHGFLCIKDNGCSLLITHLTGSIHRKSSQQDERKILMFHHPVTINFYKKEKTTSPIVAAAVLYPATVAVDIVTSPLQLIGIPLVAIGGLATMKAH